ncbi:MAG: hypothetical protein Kow00124_31110 [Anaerolineae bacterium]
METRTYRWPVTARSLAEALVTQFSQGHFVAQAQHVNDHYFIVHIGTEEIDRGGRVRNALSISIVEKGEEVHVTLEHNVLGAAGDLLETGLRAMRNPLALAGRIAAAADDLETLQLPDKVWEIIEALAANITPRDARRKDIVICPYCSTASPIGVLKCPSCGGPLGDVQPPE